VIEKRIEGLIVYFEEPKCKRCGADFDEGEIAARIYGDDCLDGWRDVAKANKVVNTVISELRNGGTLDSEMMYRYIRGSRLAENFVVNAHIRVECHKCGASRMIRYIARPEYEARSLGVDDLLHAHLSEEYLTQLYYTLREDHDRLNEWVEWLRALPAEVAYYLREEYADERARRFVEEKTGLPYAEARYRRNTAVAYLAWLEKLIHG